METLIDRVLEIDTDEKADEVQKVVDRYLNHMTASDQKMAANFGKIFLTICVAAINEAGEDDADHMREVLAASLASCTAIINKQRLADLAPTAK